MMRDIYILIFFLFVIFNANAQSNKLSKFVPEGYNIFEKYYGDLNNDGQEDCVLIIKNTDKTSFVINRFDKKVDRNRRGIVVLLKKESNFFIAEKNLSCFSSENEDGGVYFAPELSIEIKNGNLSINYSHGRYGFWSYLFRLQDSNFNLIAYESSSNYGPVINKETSINFLKKKKLIKKNTNESAEGGDEVFKETWFDIEIEKLIKLADIKDFDELKMYDY